MRKSILLCCSLLICWNAHATITPGAIALLKECPGKDRPEELDANESLPAAILSPILSFAINQGLKTTGAKLQEIAKEATVDVLHHGGHFYEWNNNKWNFQYISIVVW